MVCKILIFLKFIFYMMIQSYDLKRSIAILVLAAMFLMGSASLVFGQTDKFQLPDPGTDPDSPLYFLKSWKERIQTFFSFGAENKAKQYLHLAGVRLAEYQRMMEKGKADIAERTLAKYEDQLGRALEKLEELKTRGDDVKELTDQLKGATEKHLEVLQENLAKASEQARKGLERALEASRKGMERGGAVKVITVKLAELNNSGETGTAILKEENGKTKVTLRLSGAPKDVTQPAHIHAGSCAALGGVKWPLTFPVNGKSETTLDITLVQLRTEMPLAVNVHKSTAEAGVYVACGEISF